MFEMLVNCSSCFLSDQKQTTITQSLPSFVFLVQILVSCLRAHPVEIWVGSQTSSWPMRWWWSWEGKWRQRHSSGSWRCVSGGTLQSGEGATPVGFDLEFLHWEPITVYFCPSANVSFLDAWPLKSPIWLFPGYRSTCILPTSIWKFWISMGHVEHWNSLLSWSWKMRVSKWE